MALPLKTGADLYTQELIRARLQNFGGDLPEYGAGSIYFNTIDDTTVNSSNRIRYRGLRAWHSIANMDDIDALQKQLDELDFAGSEEFQTLSGRVLTIEGLFNNDKAKDAEKLGGQLPGYYATADGLSALQQKVNAFLDGEVDSDSVLENLKEIQAFLDSYDGATSLAEIIDSINTQIADRYTKAESDGRYLPLDGTKAMSGVLEAPKGIKIGNVVISIDNDGNLKIDGNAYATGELGSGQVAGEGGGGSTGGGYTAFDDSITWADYDDSMADWLLTAYHGKLFNDRIATLENKATKVEVSNLLTSGTKIATIKVDANSYDILAPSTDWGAITNKPTTIEGYGITDAFKAYGTARNTDLNTVKTNGSYYLIDSTINKPSTFGQMLSLRNADTTAQVYVGYNTFDNMYWRGFTDSDTNIMAWRKILDENNYDSVIGSTYTRKEEVITYNKAIDISGDTIPLHDIGYGMISNGWVRNAVAMSIGYSQSYWAQLQFGNGLMTFRTNVGGTISDWRDVLTDNNYESILDKTYLKKSGGTMTGAFRIDHQGTPYICFMQKGATLGNLVFDSQSGLCVTDSAWTEAWKVLHSGNYTSYAQSFLKSSSGGNVGTLNSWFSADNAYKFMFYGSFAPPTDKPSESANSYANALLHIARHGSGSASQLYFDESNIFYRASSVTSVESSVWHKLAFTDSDITGNATTATKFKDSVTLWGNTFDGTQGLNGNITLNNNTRIGFNYGDTVYNAISFNTVGTLAIGYDGATFRGLATHIYGGNIRFYTAAANGTPAVAMTITDRGNVTIEKAVTLKSSANVEGGVLSLGASNGTVGTSLYFNRNSVNYIWANNEGGYFAIGVKDKGTQGGGNASLIISDYSVYGGHRNNEVSLGTSDFRWSDVYSVKGDFSTSIKIGEATLSYENGALKVDKNFFAEGEVASGKVAEEGTGGNTPSGSGLEIKTFDIASTTENQMVELAHNLGTRDVVVQIFENSRSSNYQQVFADVYYVDTAKVAINFGAAQTVPHRVIIMG